MHIPLVQIYLVVSTSDWSTLSLIQKKITLAPPIRLATTDHSTPAPGQRNSFPEFSWTTNGTRKDCSHSDQNALVMYSAVCFSSCCTALEDLQHATAPDRTELDADGARSARCPLPAADAMCSQSNRWERHLKTPSAWRRRGTKSNWNRSWNYAVNGKISWNLIPSSNKNYVGWKRKQKHAADEWVNHTWRFHAVKRMWGSETLPPQRSKTTPRLTTR